MPEPSLVPIKPPRSRVWCTAVTGREGLHLYSTAHPGFHRLFREGCFVYVRGHSGAPGPGQAQGERVTVLGRGTWVVQTVLSSEKGHVEAKD